jgi:hypothetical protein
LLGFSAQTWEFSSPLTALSRNRLRSGSRYRLEFQAIEEAQRILAGYIEPGRRDALATVKALLHVLDRREVVAALNRLKAGYELYVVK